MMDISNNMIMEENENTQLGTDEYASASEAQKNAAVKVSQVQPLAYAGAVSVANRPTAIVPQIPFKQ